MKTKPGKSIFLQSLTLDLLNKAFDAFDVDLNKEKENSTYVLNLSKVYQNELSDHSQIWSNKKYLQAYLLYFLPLNVLRTSSLFAEVLPLIDSKSNLTVYDYGSGPGTTHLALINQGVQLKAIHNYDCSQKALQIHKAWANKICDGQKKHSYQDKIFSQIEAHSLGVFNYSFNEMENFPETALRHEHLLIIEPSTQKVSRRLQKARDFFQAKGFQVIAPCTHQGPCPLLIHSKKDWCHQRVFTERPKWLTQIEAQIPIKNKTVTYSYLFLSQSISANNQPNKARVIGDTLFEKGKTRQALCRGEQREFLAWLKKWGPAPEIPRGSLIELPNNFEKKANEIRLKPDTSHN